MNNKYSIGQIVYVVIKSSIVPCIVPLKVANFIIKDGEFRYNLISLNSETIKYPNRRYRENHIYNSIEDATTYLLESYAEYINKKYGNAKEA